MFPKLFQKLIDHFADLPSVGPKMAERLVLYLFKQDRQKIQQFAKDLYEFGSNLNYCKKCFHVAEKEYCSVCADAKRDKKTICVVEDPLDVIAIEKTKNYLGLYHVLGGNLSVMSQEEIKKLKINELLQRVKREKTKEVILATNPTTDGETTALYLARVIKPLGAKVTRIARGMPTGGDIEYADEITLGSSLESRRDI
ncbi:MAG: recombination mediator RecR [Candidatus Moranbacteria bacterium]|nr:recombination mediator RecR [Candidatus Moranbacteria bacterium]